MAQPNPTPKEYLDKDKLCHNCKEPLQMYEWGDWGYCHKCGTMWNMFLGKPGPKKGFGGRRKLHNSGGLYDRERQQTGL